VIPVDEASVLAVQIAASLGALLALVGFRTRPAAATPLAERWQDPPLRRTLLFDYAAGRHVEPRAQP
jgi:hypothetical protein